VHTIGFGPVPFAAFAPDLEAAGIDRVGVAVAQLEVADRAANLAALRGFDVVDLVQPAVFTLTDRRSWPAERDRLCGCAALAAEAGAPVLYLTTGCARDLDWQEAADAFAEAIAPVLPDAAALGVRLAVENTVVLRADISFVHRLDDAVDLARLAGIAVCADLFSAWTERGLGSTIEAGADSFALVQVADYVLGAHSTPDRAVPGDGVVPIARQLRHLAAAGYDGPVEVELVGPRITAEGPARAGRRARDTIAQMF
jgi:sugar phosphate isomerase/epimerase